MSKYVTIALDAVASDDEEHNPSDYRFGRGGPEEDMSTPAHVVKGSLTAPSSPAVATVPTDEFTTIGGLLVKNTGQCQLRVDYQGLQGAAAEQMEAGEMILLRSIINTSPITFCCLEGENETTTFRYMLLVTA